MVRRMSPLRCNQELQRLIDEQTDDISSTILFPEVITPLATETLEGLTISEKTSIILSVIGRMSNGEIGTAMKCNESTVRGCIKRGYRKLRRKFEK